MKFPEGLIPAERERILDKARWIIEHNYHTKFQNEHPADTIWRVAEQVYLSEKGRHHEKTDLSSIHSD